MTRVSRNAEVILVIQKVISKKKDNPVTIAKRTHLYPSRTQKLSSSAPMILGGRLPGKVGRRRFQDRFKTCLFYPTQSIKKLRFMLDIESIKC